MFPSVYKQLSVFQAALAMFLVSCASISNVVIPPQEEFTLGGNNRQVFSVKVLNQGEVPLQLSEELDHGEEIDLGYLLVDDRRRMTFLAGSSAKFTNISADTAYLKLKVASREELQRTLNLR